MERETLNNMDIGVLIVTYNRVDKLKKTLHYIDNQKKNPSYVLIVNNNSTDGTSEFLQGWLNESRQYEKVVKNLTENTGGSGGFYHGLEIALEKEAQWIYVSDDDAFPENAALFECEQFLNKHSTQIGQIAAVSGCIKNSGKIDTMHRQRYINSIFGVKCEYVSELEYKQESFEFNAFSYVGTVLNKDILKKAGITNKDYFIWFDDTEHSLRCSKHGKIYCVPKMVIHHDTATVSANANWKVYYGARNRLNMIKNIYGKVAFYREMTISLFESYINILIGRKREYNKIKLHGIKDARYNVTGISQKFRPGLPFELK